ncbi:hypothetical protein SUDANB99_05334 [Streptomyces sp. enrichment culture]
MRGRGPLRKRRGPRRTGVRRGPRAVGIGPGRDWCQPRVASAWLKVWDGRMTVAAFSGSGW